MNSTDKSCKAALTFEDHVGHLNADYFFRDFTFSSNTFKPHPSSELELADKIVWLADLLIVSQIKERNAQAITTPAREQRWFEDTVVKHATRQVRDTLSYLEQYEHIELVNNRGDTFDINNAHTKHIHKLVIYNATKLLPDDCRQKKYHRSRTAGVIHLLHGTEYLNILSILITPVEIAEYLSFREVLVNNWGDTLSSVSETSILGQYLCNLPAEKPGLEFVKYVDALKSKDRDWDISNIIHLFPERKTTPRSLPETGHKVLKQLAQLYRTEMAEFKKRFHFSMEKAIKNEAALPNRFTTSKECGFVFIPLRREDLQHRHNLLLNYTALNKYDQKLDKCIGLTFIAEGTGQWCDVQWCPLEFPWQEDAKLQASLDSHYPFRPVRERLVERYGLLDATQE